MERFFRLVRIPLFMLGFASFFAGERYLYSEAYFLIIRSFAFAAMAISALLTFILASIAGKRGNQGERRSWRIATTWPLVILFGSIMFVVYAKAIGAEAVPVTMIHKILLGTWALSYVIGIFLFIGTELSLSEGALGEFAEPDRIRRARISWATIGVMTAFLVCVNYIGSRKDKIFDWSYLKATEPSSSTKLLVGGLTDDLKISAFFPSDSDVLPFIRDYFSRIDAFSERASVEYLDKDLEPAKSEALKVSKNGIVVVSRGKQQEKINIGTTIRSARKMLSQLDEKFQGAFKGLDVTEKLVYFTRGHGELGWGGTEEDPLKKITLLESWLRNQNFTVKTLDVASGSTKEISGTDSVVVVAGPTKPFLKEEVEVLKDYVERGGKLFALLDLNNDTSDVSLPVPADDPLKLFLKDAGMAYQGIPLANVSNFLRATKTKMDHWFLFTNSFASHESLSGLSEHDEKVAIFAIRAGHFEIVPHSGNWTAFETVRTLGDTFLDLNRNQEFDPPTERKKSYSLGAGATFKNGATEGRVIAFGDSTVIADAVIRNPGNLLYAAGALSWLIGKPDAAVVGNNEEDIKIQHSKKEDAFIFYGSVALVPLMVLGVGAITNRKGRRKKEKVADNAA